MDGLCDRRAFIRDFILFACAFPLIASASAQVKPPRIRRIGFLNGAGNRSLEDAFRDELRSLGHIEGENIVIEVRLSRPNALDLPTLVAQLMQSFVYARSKWYSSITTPTPRRPRSSKLRTTRPRQSICTSRRAPTTSAGNRIVKSTIDPTGTSRSMANSTPFAEMFSVSAEYAEPSDFTEADRCSGNRGALCKSSYCAGFTCGSVIGFVPSAAIFNSRAAYTPESGKQSYRSH